MNNRKLKFTDYSITVLGSMGLLFIIIGLMGTLVLKETVEVYTFYDFMLFALIGISFLFLARNSSKEIKTLNSK